MGHCPCLPSLGVDVLADRLRGAGVGTAWAREASGREPPRGGLQLYLEGLEELRARCASISRTCK